MKIAVGIFLCLVGTASGMTRVVHEADFLTGEGTNGWTIAAGEWRSPVWPEGVMVNICASNLAQGAALQIAEENGRIVISRTNGSAVLRNVRAEWYVSQLAAPATVSITNVTTSSFRADWTPVEGAVGYRVELYSNVVENASAGIAEYTETFNKLPSKGNASALDDANLRAYADGYLAYHGENLFYGVNLPGVVQIGKTDVAGSLGVPLPSTLAGGVARTLRFTAWRYERSNEEMPIALVRAGVTNEIARVTLSTATNTFYVSLPILATGDELLFCSPTPEAGAGGEYRAVLDAFALLVAYNPGTPVKRCYRQADVSGTSSTFEDLDSVPSWVTVTARAADSADDSVASALVAVPLDAPPLMPILNAYRLSGDVRKYEATFAALAQVTKNNTPLYNGMSPLMYWMAYDASGKPLSVIGKGSATTTSGGAFAFLSADETTAATLGYALGLRAKSDCGYYYGMAFTNDLAGACSSFAVSYAAVQWGFKNALPATNRVEWLITNELVDVSVPGAWQTVAGCDYMAEPTNIVPLEAGVDCRVASRTGALPSDVKLQPGEFLLLRFAVDPMSYAAGFGWADFRVTWQTTQTGGVLLLR